MKLQPSPDTCIPLNQPLPPDLVVGMTWGPFSYRKHPVFSANWLKGRFLSSSVFVVLYGLLSMAVQAALHTPWEKNLSSTGYFIFGFLLMLNGGPLLAGWARHRGMKREGGAVVLAVAMGFIIAICADAWASSHIMTDLDARPLPAHERKISQVEEAALQLAQIGAVFVYFASGGGLACFAYFSEKRRWTARKAHIAQMESDMQLAVLQAQIEPHFLFNTLAAIRPLIRQDAAQAEQVIDALADYLRVTLPQIRQNSRSTLGQQADICASYLAVMQARMGARLRHEVDLPEALREQDFPPLMLLSLVENAIKHGIEPKPGSASVSIRARADGGQLCVSVLDDGVGLREGLQSGVGLANIREQLRLRYQERARLSVATRPEGGTIAEITLPMSS